MPKHKHNAVDRNRVKRRLRELGRTVLLPAIGAQAIDVVLRAAPEAYAADHAALAADVARIRDRLVERVGTGRA